ncbi:hypothetical protein Ae201684P_019013 [Aphanomyces euteiches]|nr:hypothetical protein Ae201684P_019013 [Aphanomyces euteiches]
MISQASTPHCRPRSTCPALRIVVARPIEKCVVCRLCSATKCWPHREGQMRSLSIVCCDEVKHLLREFRIPRFVFAPNGCFRELSLPSGAPSSVISNTHPRDC